MRSAASAASACCSRSASTSASSTRAPARPSACAHAKPMPAGVGDGEDYAAHRRRRRRRRQWRQQRRPAIEHPAAPLAPPVINATLPERPAMANGPRGERVERRFEAVVRLQAVCGLRSLKTRLQRCREAPGGALTFGNDGARPPARMSPPPSATRPRGGFHSFMARTKPQSNASTALSRNSELCTSTLLTAHRRTGKSTPAPGPAP